MLGRDVGWGVARGDAVGGRVADGRGVAIGSGSPLAPAAAVGPTVAVERVVALGTQAEGVGGPADGELGAVDLLVLAVGPLAPQPPTSTTEIAKAASTRSVFIIYLQLAALTAGREQLS